MNDYKRSATSSDEPSKTDEKKNFQPSNEPSDVTYTINDAIEHFGFGPFQIVISLFAGVSWMAEAMEMMIMSILSPALSCDWHIGPKQKAIITSCVFIGMTLSSLIWGVVCDRHGRKTGIMLISLTTFMFGMASAFAPTFEWFIALRFLMGIGIGGVPQSVTYYSEFLPVKHRATCVIGMQVFWAIGGGIESLIGLTVMPIKGWRWLVAISTMPLLLSAFTCLCVPESARYLITNGRVDEAMQTLRQIARMNGKPMLQGRLVEATKADDDESPGRIWDMFSGGLLKTTLLILPIWFVASFNYYGTVLYTTELKASGDKCHGATNETNNPDCYELTSNDYLTFVVISFMEIPGLLFAVGLLHFWGRRQALCLQFCIYTVIIFIFFNCLSPLVVMLLLGIGRAVISGAFQTAYVYTPEVYPTSLRAVAMGMASGSARVGSTISPFVAQTIISAWILYPGVIYGGVSLLACACAFFLPIETRGRRMTDHLKQVGSELYTTKVITPKKNGTPVKEPSAGNILN